MGAASVIANAATRSAIDGSSFGANLRAALPDVIGQTIFDITAYGVSLPDPQDALDADPVQQGSGGSSILGLNRRPTGLLAKSDPSRLPPSLNSFAPSDLGLDLTINLSGDSGQRRARAFDLGGDASRLDVFRPLEAALDTVLDSLFTYVEPTILVTAKRLPNPAATSTNRAVQASVRATQSINTRSGNRSKVGFETPLMRRLRNDPGPFAFDASAGQEYLGMSSDGTVSRRTRSGHIRYERELQTRAQLARIDMQRSGTVAGISMGVAIQFGADEATQDVVWSFGNVVDSFGIGRAASPRAGPVITANPRIATIDGRPIKGFINYGSINALGQRSGTTSLITPSMLRTGSKALSSIRPPGFDVLPGKNRVRGHLHANLLGGSGQIPKNLVALYQRPANSPVMRDFEVQVAKALGDSLFVNYSVTPVYRGDNPIPSGVTIVASNASGKPIVSTTVLNRGKPK